MSVYKHSKNQDCEISVLDHLCFQDAFFDDLFMGLNLTSAQAPNMSKIELLECLERLIDKDWIEAFLNSGQGCYRMSQRGFQAWQEERKPDWNRFIQYHTRLDKQYQMEYWEFQAQSKEVILDFIEIHQSLGIIAKCDFKLTQQQVPLTRHKFVSGYTSQFQSQHQHSTVTNQRVEELRNWWSSAAEILNS